MNTLETESPQSFTLRDATQLAMLIARAGLVPFPHEPHPTVPYRPIPGWDTPGQEHHTGLSGSTTAEHDSWPATVAPLSYPPPHTITPLMKAVGVVRMPLRPVTEELPPSAYFGSKSPLTIGEQDACRPLVLDLSDGRQLPRPPHPRDVLGEGHDAGINFEGRIVRGHRRTPERLKRIARNAGYILAMASASGAISLLMDVMAQRSAH